MTTERQYRGTWSYSPADGVTSPFIYFCVEEGSLMMLGIKRHSLFFNLAALNKEPITDWNNVLCVSSEEEENQLEATGVS